MSQDSRKYAAHSRAKLLFAGNWITLALLDLQKAGDKVLSGRVSKIEKEVQSVKDEIFKKLNG